MSKTRRTIADTMYYAWTHIPHVTQYDRADITDLETFRKAHAAEVEKAGGKLSVTSILVKIAASALKAFPQFNASVDIERNEIIYKKYCHIAVAVDTDRGLLVPVIRDVDKKSIRRGLRGAVGTGSQDAGQADHAGRTDGRLLHGVQSRGAWGNEFLADRLLAAGGDSGHQPGEPGRRCPGTGRSRSV